MNDYRKYRIVKVKYLSCKLKFEYCNCEVTPSIIRDKKCSLYKMGVINSKGLTLACCNICPAKDINWFPLYKRYKR